MAAAVISPIVEQSRQRLGGICDAVWSDPYIIGFVVMLISVVAKLESGELAERAISRVQCGAWRDITSARGGSIAERFMMLNIARDRDFELGCRNAAMFARVLFGRKILLQGAGVPVVDAVLDCVPSEREDVRDAWSQLFDAHILARADDCCPERM